MAKITEIGYGCNNCPYDRALADPFEKIHFVEFGFDPLNQSLDIFFKRESFQWNNGVGIQLNNLSESDKKTLIQYLEEGR